jgi:hypothetical protein
MLNDIHVLQEYNKETQECITFKCIISANVQVSCHIDHRASDDLKALFLKGREHVSTFKKIF